MQTISERNFTSILEKNIFDNCMLLPSFDNDVMAEEKTCYICDNSINSFLCVIKYKEIYQIPPSIELFAETDEAADEIIEKILMLESSGYDLVSYKNDKVIKNIALRKHISSDIQYLKSYYAPIEKDYSTAPSFNSVKIFINDNVLEFDEHFLNQSGNHIIITIKAAERNPEDYKIIYLLKDDNIIGYIALYKKYKNIWDTSFIFIDERERKRGYGQYLCGYAADYLKKQNRTLFYSYCATPASEKTAVTSGLLPCAERYITSIIL
ncbi:MAG: GNAT family N-acetyltransferase [Oscillospiraceae bacterium]|nr:GNAT family N-acetyltransferase [Oscillospiraceae bacterium]